MAIARYIRMPVMACADALSNGIAIGMRAFVFASASMLAMLTDIAPFFDEMFIQVGLESTLSAGLRFGWNSDWGYSLENGWNARLKAGIWVWEKQRFKDSDDRNFDFDEMDATRFANGSTFAGGWI
jgi:hypothetical protein